MRLLLFLLLSGVTTLAGPAFTYNASGPQREGLLAEYYFDEGSGQVAHNHAATLPVGYNNLFQLYTRVLDSYNEFDPNGGGTITAAGLTDPTGGTNAYRIQAGASSPVLKQNNTGTIPAGHITASVWLKSNDGTDQVVNWYNGGFSPNITIPAAAGWTNISITYNNVAPVAGYVIWLYTLGASSVDLLGYGWKLETGSSATQFLLDQGDMSLGWLGYTDAADPAWTASGLSVANGTTLTGAASFPEVVVNRVSAYAVVKTGWSDYSGVVNAGLISDKWADNGIELYIQKGANSFMGFSWGGIDAQLTAVRPYDGNWHMVGVVYDGSSLYTYFDDALSGTVTTGASNLTDSLKQLFLSGYSLGQWGSNYELAYFALYDVAHSGWQVKHQFESIRKMMGQRSVAITKRPTLVCFGGDSITAGYMAAPRSQLGYAALVSSNLNFQAGVAASGSATLAILSARASRLDALLDPTRTNVLFLLEGVNDIDALGTNAWYAAYTNYVATRKLAGWKTVVATVLPGTTLTDANRNAVNGKIRADYTQYADALADFAADPHMGCNGCNLTNTYWNGDQLHPNTAGHAILAPIAQAAIQPLLP